MHFSIPDTCEKSENDGPFTVFNLHINGILHGSVRYSQFRDLHVQLQKAFGSNRLPAFPPKKLLSLNSKELEERRILLERYVQTISQDAEIGNSTNFVEFLLVAQQITHGVQADPTTIEICLMNGHRVEVQVLATDRTDTVLCAAANEIHLLNDFIPYFALYLVKREPDGDMSIVRRMQEFESPYVSLKTVEKIAPHRIVLRKSYWDPSFDEDLLSDRIALNLLYVQAVSDLDRGWIAADSEVAQRLRSLQSQGSKREFIELAKTVKFYGYVHLKKCTCDYPREGTPVSIIGGNRELIFRLELPGGEAREVSFRVTRMRCWRITTSYGASKREAANNHENGSGPPREPALELSFEYLVAKDTLKWISVVSPQAILLSMCLQSMVDEILLKKNGEKPKRATTKTSTLSIAKGKRSNAASNEPVSAAPTWRHRASFTAGGEKTKNKAASDEVQGNEAFDSAIGDEDL